MNAARLTDKRLGAITKFIGVLSIVDSALLLDESPTRRRACTRLEQGCGYSALRTVLRFRTDKCGIDLAREQEHDFANNDEIRFLESLLAVLQIYARNRDSTFTYARTQNSYWDVITCESTDYDEMIWYVPFKVKMISRDHRSW